VTSSFIRYEGPKGGPGMREMLTPTSLLGGMGLIDSVALITDGRFSGGFARACIGHISPEAASRGPIAALKRRRYYRNRYSQLQNQRETDRKKKSRHGWPK